jgi:hypothetical protein
MTALTTFFDQYVFGHDRAALLDELPYAAAVLTGAPDRVKQALIRGNSGPAHHSTLSCHQPLKSCFGKPRRPRR